MNRLEAAKAWYESRLQSLTVIDEWMRERPGVPAVIRPLVQDFQDRKQGRERFKKEREDLKRVALIRIFSGFEADFRERFPTWLKAKLDAVDPAQSAERKSEVIRSALPDSIESCLSLFRALEPRFSGSDKGWIDTLRAFRNSVVHGGFPDIDVKEDPVQAYEQLRRILRYLD
ncbi:hypothetical protein ACMHYB_03700 [Sorangium sp. So ce1128]